MQNKTAKLSYKIIEILKAGPSSNDILAKQLGQNLKAVESQTFRLTRAGEIKKLRRGVYGYLEATSATATTPIREQKPGNHTQSEHPQEPAKQETTTGAP